MTTTSRTVRGLIVIAVVASLAPLRAQQANRVAVAVNAMHEQIDRIFSARAYESPRFGPARWMPDGTAYAIVESANGGSEIAKYDAATGARTVLVPASKLVRKGSKHRSTSTTTPGRRRQAAADLHQHETRGGARTRAAITGCSIRSQAPSRRLAATRRNRR
jgi:hypothetical protein